MHVKSSSQEKYLEPEWPTKDEMNLIINISLWQAPRDTVVYVSGPGQPKDMLKELLSELDSISCRSLLKVARPKIYLA